ncbi:DUF1285 domain-containing protein [Shewanella sp. D64]|uniref:DUF1285 domain-containing protein n=1 Tax=unclassified Shewanella TaxID=196818 RepID=UPI0022BA5DB6|nr:MULTISPECIES: DUF1285 domain-containing protein [unclassified Shewanella]MEC4725408.1 DUF1285 domain-containing protein [Shewanella sp. D64]MEC4735746.1 DUF1285 domain-containing protein [Shewanella sp. E94]WBJ93281.1 DUF1285 domain-containing protein [Shewanella sp. MTB7]
MNDKGNPVELALTKVTQEAKLCSEAVLFKIDAQGDWFYLDGSLPTKFARLFSSILNHIEGDYFLITPAEKLKVEVVDHPLIIVDYHLLEMGGIEVITSLDTKYMVDSIDDFNVTDEGITVLTERNLTAKLGRACYYRYINQFIVTD